VSGARCHFMHHPRPGDVDLPPLAVKPPEITEKALPVGPDRFADSILDGKPYRLRAVLTCGNPLLASANTKRVRDAFARLEFYAFIGLFMEESAYYADVILPACSGLEIDG